jgi:ribosomal protein S14
MTIEVIWTSGSVKRKKTKAPPRGRALESTVPCHQSGRHPGSGRSLPLCRWSRRASPLAFDSTHSSLIIRSYT